MNQSIMWLKIERPVLPDSDRMICEDCGCILKDTFWQIGIISIATRGKRVCKSCATEIEKNKP